MSRLNPTQAETLAEIERRQRRLFPSVFGLPRTASVSAFVPGSTTSYNPMDPRFRQTMRADIERLTGSSGLADLTELGVDFAPLAGTMAGIGDTRAAFGQGDILGGMILGGGTLLGAAIPGVAKGSKIIKSGLDRAKLGRQYPDIGEPIPKVDKDSGKSFLAKGKSDEATAVEKEVANINKDIKAGNYTGFFPVNERFYVNPSNYPLEGNTLTDALPKTQKTIDKFQAKYDTPAVRKRLSEAYDEGITMGPGVKDWYAMGQLENEFIKEYGEAKGRKLFKERFADPMAVTTAGADPSGNLKMASYLNYLKNQGAPFPTGAFEMPYPIGGRFAMSNVKTYDSLLNQGTGLSPFGQPKRFNFSANFLGDVNRGTIDEHMMKGFDLRPKPLQAPEGDSYGVLERVLQDVAREKGVAPANLQEGAWFALRGKPETPKPMIEVVNESIERTARLTGKSPQEVVRDSLIRANSPLYSLLGGVGAGAALMSQNPFGQRQSEI